jgi:hypothetical protein
MKPILLSVALVTAVAIATPAGAQQAPSSGPPPHPVQPLGRMPAGGPPVSERGIPGSVERAHHRPHRVYHSHPMHAGSPSPADNQADQLNRQELSQIPR